MLITRKAHNAPRVKLRSTPDQQKIKCFVLKGLCKDTTKAPLDNPKLGCYFLAYHPARYPAESLIVPMIPHMILTRNRIAFGCFLLAVVLSGCNKPAPQSSPEASPAKPAAQAGPPPSANDMEAGAAMLRILNAAH